MVIVHVWDPKDIWELSSGWGHASIDIGGYYFSHWPDPTESSFLNLVFGGRGRRIHALKNEKAPPDYSLVLHELVEPLMVKTIKNIRTYSGPYANCSSVIAQSIYDGLREFTLWNPFKIWTPLLVMEFADSVKRGYGMGVHSISRGR